MVGRYIRQTQRQSWSEEAMETAIKAVQSKEMGWLKAARTHEVPQATLRRRAQNKNKNVKGAVKILGRFRTVFTEDEENLRKQEKNPVKRRLSFMDDDPDSPPALFSDDDNDNPPCLYCNGLFKESRSREKWVQCANSSCRKWAHSYCAGIDATQKFYEYKLCNDSNAD